MVTRVGRCYGPAFARPVGRSALGMLVAALVAIAVLVHHDSTAMAGPHDMSRISVAAMAEPGADHLSAAPHASHSRAAGPSAHTVAPAGHVDNAMNCDEGAVQHCGAASIKTTKLSPPKEAFRAGAATHTVLSRAPVTARSAERAPPKLSALSQLRI
ncbi:hypothetical protein PV396_43150 [Streptomyces sp. ME02-8801-2C]|uniref:hypothetical protein n=1 Tax=Streptomyces sp. ME02-8801-2C TaxID=3028680 RepID=UPI0029ACEFB9|nr:hypothetical protein [Streptomyces sp. ME02-8801-2C]MDX3458649.1 hypothetical protein [Streptomyces sp. ME02-8801-2C]